MISIGSVVFSYIRGKKDMFMYKYVSSVVNLRNKIPKNHNLAKLLKDVNNKLTEFKVTENYPYIFESTMLNNHNIFDSIYDCGLLLLS